ncbi:MAG: cytidylyltransferase domain-containing protein [Acidimicrobiia bacterium]
MRVVAIVQARMGSSRLPGKVLDDLAGMPVLAHVIERLRQARELDEVVVATPDTPADVPLHEFVQAMDTTLVVGDEADVLSRYVTAAELSAADVVVRITSDCPVIDPNTVDAVVAAYRSRGVDYVSGGPSSGYPRGLDTEVFSVDALHRVDALAAEGPEREHVTLRMYRDSEHFRFERCAPPAALHRPEYRLCVDEPDDIALLRLLYQELGSPAPAIDLRDIVALLDARPDLVAINAHVEQKTV